MQLEEITTSTAEVKCVGCGTTFETTVIRMGDRSVTPRRCEECLRLLDGIERSEPESESSEADTIVSALIAAGVNVKKFGRASLEPSDTLGTGFVLDDGNHHAHLAAKSFVQDVIEAGPYDPIRGLMLVGTFGTGKTQLAVGCMVELLKAGAVSPGHIHWRRTSRLITSIQSRYSSGTVDEFLRPLEDADLLILDDLGTEKGTDDALRILSDLIDARQGHPTIITANEPPDRIGLKFSDELGWGRIRSRLGRREYRPILIQGADRRADRDGA